MDSARAQLMKDTKDNLVTRILLLKQNWDDVMNLKRGVENERNEALRENERILQQKDDLEHQVAELTNQRDALLDAIEDFHEAEAEATMRRRRLDASNGRLADLFSRFNASRMAVMNAMSFQPVRDLDNDTVRWQRRG